MKTVRVTYTARQEYAGQNQQNIQKVMSDLQQLNHPGLLYHCCVNADGKTFVHTAFFKSEQDERVLLDLPSFKSFQQQLMASGPEVPPKQELPAFVGSSHNMFNA